MAFNHQNNFSMCGHLPTACVGRVARQARLMLLPALRKNLPFDSSLTLSVFGKRGDNQNSDSY